MADNLKTLEALIERLPLPAKEKALALEGARRATPERRQEILDNFHRAKALKTSAHGGKA